MSDQPPQEPFDPYRPPPPGSPPPVAPSYGPPPSSYGPYRSSSRPVWFGALGGLVLCGVVLWLSFFVVPEASLWLMLAAAILVITLILVPTTRRWGQGMLIGTLLSIPVGAIIFAGVCVALIVSYQGGA